MFLVILTAFKEGIQSYWDTFNSSGSFNRMWILQYWIFWIILIIVVFQKYRVSNSQNDSNTYSNYFVGNVEAHVVLFSLFELL
jgi:heme/copper-type cytochrome/quinol oxidase subunit 2